MTTSLVKPFALVMLKQAVFMVNTLSQSS